MRTTVRDRLADRKGGSSWERPTSRDLARVSRSRAAVRVGSLAVKQMQRGLMALVGVAAAVAASACSSPTCLLGGSGCDETAPCATLSFSCDGGEVSIGRVPASGAAGTVDLENAEAAAGDIVMRNDQLTVVIDDLGEPHDLASTGGSIIDLGPRGGRDDINLIYQIAGILPDDGFAYDDVEIEDRSPAYVAVVLRGTLDGRSDVLVATRYELHACEPGLRVRSELVNLSTDIQAFIVSDVAHWGKRRVLPFAPIEAQGFVQPKLDLVKIGDSWAEFPYLAARAPGLESPTYGVVSCSSENLEGVNDPEISATGTPRTVVRPGESLVFERFLTASPANRALADGVDVLLDAATQLHGAVAARQIKGRITAGSLPFGGDVRRASVVLYEQLSGGRKRPVTSFTPGVDGLFNVRAPNDVALGIEIWSFGRVVLDQAIETRTGGAELGDLEVELPATVTMRILDETDKPIHGIISLHPADEATAASVAGSFHGRFDTCAPWLGPPHGGSPACNRVLLTPLGADVEVPVGNYQLFATAGPEYSLGRSDLVVTPGDMIIRDIAVVPVEVSAPNWLSADLHVHGRRSFDSSIPDTDRVHSFAAAGIDVIAATDHDYVTAYETTIGRAGVENLVAVMGGMETTQLIPWMDVPDDDFPRVIGHFNFWPLTPNPAAPRGGGPWDERLEPGELYDLMKSIMGGGGLAMMNHPWDESQFGRDLGYLRAIKFDPRRPIPATDDGSRNGMLRRSPGGGAQNIDFDVIELGNGASIVQLMKTRPLWFSLLSQGFVQAAAANSDSHGLSDNQLGYGRNYVEADTEVIGFDAKVFNAALVDGRAVGGNGVFISVTVGGTTGERRGLGFTPYVPVGGDTLDIEVRAAPWIHVDEVRVVTSKGTVIVADASAITVPADPFGTEGVSRWHGVVELASIIGPGDDWVVVEAGMSPWLAADLDDNGVVDTSDNNGDGVVDAADVEPDEDTGPLHGPPDPVDETDPRWPMTRVIPDAWPYGFTNPILIDRDGDGYDAPGLLGGAQ